MSKFVKEPGLEEPEPVIIDESTKVGRAETFAWENSKTNKPRCYFENNSKEELVLEHVMEYKRQFKVIYDPLRKLLLAPKNERGLRKFICTTIRPTKLPFTELYEWEKCAKFVSEYLEYEELFEPDKFPDIIPSPANILDWQKGDSFDLSIVLCSFLVGAGYDAYVVYGTAPRRITVKDESLMDCPFDCELPADEEDMDPEVDEDAHLMEQAKKDDVKPVDDFNIDFIKLPDSQFDMNQRAKQKEAEKIQHIKDTVIDDDEPDYEQDDEFGRSRKHCWVYLQKGPRELADSFFIEPSTGRKYNTEESPYHTIEAIFNHKNYWINMDVNRGIDEVNLEFENDTSGEWEYVMISSGEKKEDGEGEGEEEEEDSDGEGGGETEEVLDMPPPWSPKLFISKEKYHMLMPGGSKTLFYKKCKVELFAECHIVNGRVDGLVKRVTLFQDYKRLILKETRQFFEGRRDKLKMRRRFPYEFKTIEHYDPSDKYNYWKTMVEVDDVYRKIWYYHHRVNDGLIYREEQIGQKTFERYTGREDKLIYRSCTVDPNIVVDVNKDYFITDKTYNRNYYQKKVAQKFELDKTKPASEQIRKTEFHIQANQVFIYYHYEEGQIFRKPVQINRMDLIQHGKMGDVGDKEGGGGDEGNKKQQFYQSINEMESQCRASIKQAEVLAFEEKIQRKENEKLIQQLRQQPLPDEVFSKVLEKSIYEKARDKMKEGKAKVTEESDKVVKKDFLASILKKLSLEDQQELDEEAAINVKNEALKNLKERLITRADIIQQRLTEEQKTLEQAFATLRRKGEAMTAEDEQKYDNDIHKANFRIDILTERASQHYRTSLKRFEQMDNDLNNDERLKVLRQNKQ